MIGGTRRFGAHSGGDVARVRDRERERPSHSLVELDILPKEAALPLEAPVLEPRSRVRLGIGARRAGAGLLAAPRSC
jgi:hypothetical protein